MQWFYIDWISVHIVSSSRWRCRSCQWPLRSSRAAAPPARCTQASLSSPGWWWWGAHGGASAAHRAEEAAEQTHGCSPLSETPQRCVSEPERPWGAAADRGVQIHLQTPEWSGSMAGGRRGLVAPQNTFLENIVRRSNGKDAYGVLNWEIETVKLNLSLCHSRINCQPV